MFMLTVMDARQLSSTLNLTVRVTDDINYSIKFNQSFYFVSITEDVAVNTTLLTVYCTNNYNEHIDNLRYSFVESNSLFRLVSSTGLLIVIGSLDYELQGYHYLSVECVDSTAQHSTAVVIVTVFPIKEHSPMLIFDTLEVTVTENTTVGQRIIQVNATDQDHSNQLRYYLNNNISSFYLDAVIGGLYLIQFLDYESQASYNLSVTAVDQTSMTRWSAGNIIINVMDVNDNAPYCEPSFIIKVISDNMAVGQSVAMLNCSDDDSGINSQLQFTLVYNNSNLFAINKDSGDIIVAKDLNVSTSSLIIVVSDKGTPALSFTVVAHISIQQILNHTSIENGTISEDDEGKMNSVIVSFSHLTLELVSYVIVMSYCVLVCLLQWHNGGKQRFLNATAKAVTYFCAINSQSCSLEPFCVR